MASKEFRIILDFLNDAVSVHELPMTDAIFVHGFIDPRVALHAAHLFRLGKAPKVLVSGGIGTLGKDPYGFPTKADHYAEVLKEGGVPEEALILEKKASNTLENVRLGIRAAYEREFYPKSLIVVALSPLLRRARATFAKHCSYIRTFGSSFDIDESEWQTEDRVRRVLEEVERLRKYAQKGDIIKVKIPPEVFSAYKTVSARLKCSTRFR